MNFTQRAVAVLGDGSPAEAGLERTLHRAKFVGETVLLLHGASAVADPDVKRQVAALAEMIAPHARSAEFLTLARLRTSAASEVAVAHSCLTALGLPAPEFDHAIRAVLQEGNPVAERAPWKDLEAAWLTRLCDDAPAVPNLDISLGRTTLAGGLDAIFARREELYAFTHALIYLTDFGLAPTVPPRGTPATLADAEAGLARCLDEDDFDLAAELLLFWPYLNAPLTPVASFALTVLTEVEDDVGFLPPLGLTLEKLAEVPEERRKYHVFDEAYHTIYVMGLLAAAMLHSPVPDAPISPQPALAQAFQEICMLMPSRDSAPHWERKLPTDGPAQEGIFYFVVDVAIRRALIANDLRRLHAILEICAGLAALNSVVIRQSAHLLGRFVAA